LSRRTIDGAADLYARRRLRLFIEHADRVKPLRIYRWERRFKQSVLQPDCLLRNHPIPRRVSRKTNLQRNAKDYKRGVKVESSSNPQELFAVLALQTRRVSNCESAEAEPLFDYEVHRLKRFRRRVLIRWVI
jgi:hypothetical protein